MLTVADLHRAIGLVKSLTVAVPVQVDVFPLAAVAVKVTTFGPTLEQLKVEGLTHKLTYPVEPLLIPVAVIEPLPAELNTTIALRHFAT